ncbi:hypothetical protein [Streptomyces chartreusis]|uniref:hypothetical protein n=1 Tax=Streptomyces chartreusis TaxID=1969 RepID=UPI002E17A442
MPSTSWLLARASYNRYAYSTDPMVPGELTRATAAQATAETRAHLAADSRPRRIQAHPYGAVILCDGDRRVRFDPWQEAMPKYLTAKQAVDLHLLASATVPARLVDVGSGYGPEVQGSSLVRIPPAATNRLVRHGYLALDGTGQVVLSLAGVVALEWRHCKTTGVEPGQWADLIAEAVVDTLTPDDPQG